MDLRRFTFAVVLLTGLLLVGYAIATMPPSQVYYVDVQAPETARALPTPASVIEYEQLSPVAQEAFVTSLETGRPARIGASRGGAGSGYIHYEGAYYLTLLATVNNDTTPELILIFCGVTLFLLGGVGWWVDRTRIVRHR